MIAAAGAFALVLGLLPLAQSAQATPPPGERDTDGEASTASDPYPTYETYPGSPGNVVERDAENGLPATDRYRGVRRHDTAGQIAADDQTVQGTGFHDADEVLLARADEFPDSLAGSFAAGLFDAPILLVDTTGPIEENTEAALEVIDPETITVLGGTNAVSNQAATDAAAIGTQTSAIERLSGTTRFETAEEIAGAGDVAEHEGNRTAFLATGLEFADALAGGQLSFQGHPILLTTPDELHSAAERAINDNNIEHVIFLGGTNAIDASVEAEVTAEGATTERVGDADRAGTATKVAQMAIDEFGFSADHLTVATGFRFPDALTAGPHAGKEMNPLFLARGTTFLDGAGGNETQPSEFLAEHACDTGSIHIAGGHAAISEGLEDTIRGHSDCPLETDAETITVTVEPETQTVGETATATATVLDGESNPVESATVTFDAVHESGTVVPSDGSDDTDAAGEATFEFTTPETGTVTVTGETTNVDGDPISDDDSNTFVGPFDDVNELGAFSFDVASEREVANGSDAGGGAEGSASAFIGTDAGQEQVCVTMFVDSVDGSIDDWPGGSQALHIHDGDVDENGPIEVFFDNPVQEGDTASKSLECVDITPALAAQIVADPGGFYLNLHTDEFPGGNARGQLDGSWDGVDRSDGV